MNREIQTKSITPTSVSTSEVLNCASKQREGSNLSVAVKKAPMIFLLTLLFLLLTATSFLTVNAVATTYYVATNGLDTNPGTLASPFLTIQKGINMASIAGAGSYVIVRGGEYHPTSTLSITTSGISLKNYTGELPIISGQNYYPHTSLQQLTYNGTVYEFSWSPLISINASNIIIDGFDIRDSYGTGVYAGSSTTVYSNITVRNSDIHGNSQQAVFFEKVNGFMLDNCKIHWNGIMAPFDRDPASLNWPLIVMIKNVGSGTIQKCEVYHNWGEGVGLWCDSSWVSVLDNKIYDNYAVELYIDKAKNIIVARNFIYNTGDPTYFRNGWACTGIMIADEVYQSYTPGHDRRIVNNILVGNGCNFMYWNTGLTGTHLYNDIFVNNTLVNPQGTNIKIDSGAIPHSNVQIKNNIVTQTTGTLQNVAQDTGLIFANNLWSASVTGVAWGTNSIIGNPLFVGGSTYDPTSYKIQTTSPAIDMSATPAIITTDFFNTTRTTTPDIGAHENR